MDFFNVVSVDEGRNILADNFKDYKFQLETINILEATNRVLAEDIYSPIFVPEFNRSTVDGYGIMVEDSYGATDSIPSILHIIGEVKMGKENDIGIKSGQTQYVPTGGMLPRGANGVIMIENTELMDNQTLLIYKPISQSENIIYKGDDIEKGELVLNKGRIISPEVIGVLASLGISEVNVYKKPKFFILSTGDEIIDLDEELTMGKIRDINSYALSSLIEKSGGIVVGMKIVKDDYEILKEEVEKAIDISDILLISGGSSVGTKDYTYKVINSLKGKGVLAHGLAIKPGKPTIIGEGKGKLIMGLPGHPVSSIMVFKVLIEDFIRKKLGIEKIHPKVNAIMDFNFPSSPGRETYQMVQIREENGLYYGKPTFGKSGMITLLANSHGYIIIGSYEEGIYKGEIREVYLL